MLNGSFNTDNIYFSDDNNKTTNINEIAFVSIKSSASNDSLEDLEIIEKTIHRITSYDEINTLNDKCNCKVPEEISYNDSSTQTSLTDNNENLNLELSALRIKYTNLEKNFTTVSNLLKNFVAIDKENPQLDEIKIQLALIVNRELRQHHAFPFISFVNKF
ncbi:MAG: hypothetical protein WD512_05260 [Candidatus Paceibacterota bacterium]